MSNPFVKSERVNSWVELLKHLVIMNRIDHFHIQENGLKLSIVKNDKLYYINFLSENNIRASVRDIVIEKLINDI